MDGGPSVLNGSLGAAEGGASYSSDGEFVAEGEYSRGAVGDAVIALESPSSGAVMESEVYGVGEDHRPAVKSEIAGGGVVSGGDIKSYGERSVGRGE